MPTPIGNALNDRRPALAAAAVVAAGVVACDMLFWRHEGVRVALGVVALVAHGTLARWDRDSLGLRLRPVQGLGYWVRTTAVIAAAIGVFVAVAVAAMWYADRLVVYTLAPRDARRFFASACVYAPLVEEAVYRFAVCVPAAALLGTWGTVLVSGGLFAALHFVYGNPGPDNFIAGFFLAWAYLKSGSIAVPVVLHALGNVVAGGSQLAAHYWLTQ